MLKKVTAWVKSHPGVRLDERAAMACAHAVGVNSHDETMFRAVWNMVQDFARLSAINESVYAGTAAEAVIETSEKPAIVVVAWPDCSAHVTTFRAALGVARRAAYAVRHDLGRMFSRRFF